MSLQKLPIASMQKISRYVRGNLVIPELENNPPAEQTFEDLHDIPEPASLGALGDLFRVGSAPNELISTPNTDGRWFISTAEPGAIFTRLPGLKLKPGFKLVTYLWRNDTNGLGVTWAIPEQLSDTARLEDALQSASDADNPPYPEGALLNVMSAIQGDRSATSFVTASILQRELKEFGLIGHQADWIHHRFISSVPQQRQWQWRMKPPSDLTPKVRLLPDGQAAVEFFSCRVVPPIGIYRHVDHFPIGQYTAKSINQPIATVPEVAAKS